MDHDGKLVGYVLCKMDDERHKDPDEVALADVSAAEDAS